MYTKPLSTTSESGPVVPEGWRANNEMVYPGSAARPKSLACWPEVFPVLADGVVVVVVVVVSAPHADKIRTSAAAIQQREVAKLALDLMTGNIALLISYPTFSNYVIGTRVVHLMRVYQDIVKRLLTPSKSSRDNHY